MKKITQKNMMLIAMSLFLGMIFIDEASVAITLPDIQRQFGETDLGLQWIMNALFLPLSVLVLFAGSLADRLGSRKTFDMGLVIFWVASIICTFCPNHHWLIIGRIGQGIGASMLLATYTILLGQVFSANERGFALGSCASYASLFLAIGPLLGGGFAHYLSWRWVFALNLILAPVIFWLTHQCTEIDVPRAKPNRLDILGMLLFLIGFSGLIFALMQAVVYGWHSLITKSLIGSCVVLLLLFFVHERRISFPTVDFSLFKQPIFLYGNVILLCAQVIVMCLTYWAIWLQQALEMSAFTAGLALLPAGIPILVMGKVGGRWLDRHGPRPPILLGTGLILFGMLELALTAPYQSYPLALIGFLSYGVGAPLVISPAIAAVLSHAPHHQQGMAAGILNTMRQLGAALCFAIVGVVITNTLYLHTTQLTAADYSLSFSYGMYAAALFGLLAFCSAYFGLQSKEK